MVIDILLAVIFIGSMVLGYRSGFIGSVLHTFGWLGSCILAFFLDGYVSGFMKEHTEVYDNIRTAVEQNTALDADMNISFMPDLFTDFAEKTQDMIIKQMTDTAFAVLCFLLTMMTIRIIFWLLKLFFSKKHNDGVIGFTDGLLGMAAGIIRGGLLVLLILALMYPVMAFVSQDLASHIMDELASSHFSGYLYEHNPLLLFLGHFTL